MVASFEGRPTHAQGAHPGTHPAPARLPARCPPDEFPTAVGHITDQRRQEFILLSDVLGASMQTFTINNEAYENATEATGAPGEPCWGGGHGHRHRREPLPGALIEVWQADAGGTYDVQYSDDRTSGRGHLHADDAGHYHFWAITPTPYPIPHDGPVGQTLAATGRSPMRAAHLHLMVTADGFRRLVTTSSPSDDELLDRDGVFGVRDSLVLDFERQVRNRPGARPPAGSTPSSG